MNKGEQEMGTYRIVRVTDDGERYTLPAWVGLGIDEVAEVRNELMAARPLGSSIQYQIVAE
jgi:hypothetical protein